MRPTQPTQPIHSSRSLGWPDIEVGTYQEPAEAERWAEPVSNDVTVMLLMQGTAYLHECDRDSCKGFHLRPHDLLLKPSAAVIPDLQWRTLSPAPALMLRMRLSHGLYRRTVEEVADRDPALIDLAPLAGFQDPLLLHIGLMLWRELESSSPISPLYTQTAAHMLVVHLLRTYATRQVTIEARRNGLTPQHVRRVTDYVQAALAGPISLEDMAVQTGYSPYHFARLFRRAVGESPYQFVLRQRIERAQHLLRSTGLSLVEIAIESGFSDQSHLTQTFRRYTGLTPNAFRSLVRNSAGS